jgi:ubiquinone/menaquinone biosynthesis C-methylase UbiE
VETSLKAAELSQAPVASKHHEIDWDTYASQYDLLATNNPSYFENIEALRSVVRDLQLPKEAAICDVGAGTGNFICALAHDLPEARYVHLDFDAGMNKIAADKYSAMGLEHIELECCRASEAHYAPQSFDLIISVNALYAMQPQREVLRRIRSWLKPDGTFFVIDYGRQVNVLDWVVYMFRHVARTKGFWAAVKLLKKNAENIRQNRKGSQGQADGHYWLHSTEEFGEILVSM